MRDFSTKGVSIALWIIAINLTLQSAASLIGEAQAQYNPNDRALARLASAVDCGAMGSPCWVQARAVQAKGLENFE